MPSGSLYLEARTGLLEGTIVGRYTDFQDMEWGMRASLFCRATPECIKPDRKVKRAFHAGDSSNTKSKLGLVSTCFSRMLVIYWQRGNCV